MPSAEPRDPTALRPLDAAAMARVQRRLLAAPQAPWLHGEVARRMAERLPVIKLKPGCIADWGAFLGASHGLLAQAYPQARILAVEPDASRRDSSAAALARPWWSPRRWSGAVAAITQAEVGAGQVQLLWSNMGLHGASDPLAVLRQWQQALAVDGFVMFSTLGPGSLSRLRSVYRQQGWGTPFAPFVDMHDLGDLLIEAGFADPVMDQETLTLTWPSAAAMIDELHALGGNVALDRHPGLRTPRWRRRLLQALAAGADADGRVAMDFELVYGHAFRPAPRARLAAHTEVPLDDLRAMVRAGRSVR
ncbi:MAG: biotin synthase [Leptothrix sp. (in: Bacteria)]|nr:biotin synthase [Leptothrix sp. (in: b-proteobacteria)]